MGIPGLWSLLNAAQSSRSLFHLAVVDGFDSNKSGKRAYRLGIDASIWFQHAAATPEGENPALRCLFFKLAKLAAVPIIPLFVFDGRLRPKTKRGGKKGKSGSHELIPGFKTLLDAFGMQWREAKAEAEAELAALNRAGFLDAVLSDDGDAFVFGATTVIKNWSVKLSGNKSSPAVNLDGKPSKDHVHIYNAADIKSHRDIGLTRGGLILFALISGGDYDMKGVSKFGTVTAHALARCPFGDELLTAYNTKKEHELRHFLVDWRASVNEELRSNALGFMRRASNLTLPEDFPPLDILEAYANPIVAAHSGNLHDKGQLDLAKLSAFVEKHFEWGYRVNVIKRFRDLMWGPAVMHVLRRASLEADAKYKATIGAEPNFVVRNPLKPSDSDAIGTPSALVQRYLCSITLNSTSSKQLDGRRAAFANQGHPHLPEASTTMNLPDPHPLFVRIVKQRQHISTDKLLEYGVEIRPNQLVTHTSTGIKGTRPAPDSIRATKKSPPEPLSVLLMWLPATMVHQVHPGMVEEYILGGEERSRKTGKRKAAPISDAEPEQEDTFVPTQKKKRAAASVSRRRVRTPAVSSIKTPPPPIDPWFTSSPATSPTLRRSYSLHFSNPDDSDAASSDVVMSDTESGVGSSFMDHMFNRIIGLEKPLGVKKASARKKRAPLASVSVTPATAKASRHVVSSSAVLDAVDRAVSSSSKVRRHRTMKSAESVATAETPPDISASRSGLQRQVQQFPMIKSPQMLSSRRNNTTYSSDVLEIESSDEDLPSTSSAFDQSYGRTAHRSSISRPPTNSSQESRQNYSDDIIDLT